MAIEINEFAQVSISVSPTGVSAGNFGILGFLTNESDVITTPAERSRSYTSLASVGADWDTSSEVYKAATAFYGQTPSPKDFTVIVNFRDAQPATLVGGGTDTVEELIAKVDGTAGDLEITTDSGTVTLEDLDLSSIVAGGHLAIADAIEILLQASVGGTTMTCDYDGYRYIVGTGTPAAARTIVPAVSSPAALALGLTQSTASTSDGIDSGETATAALNHATSSGTPFVGLVTSKDYRDDSFNDDSGDSAVDIAKWAVASDKIFCNTTNDLTCLVVGSTNVASKLKLQTLDVLTTFSRDPAAYPSAGVFGRAASVNFSAIGSTITMNLKQISGVTAEDLSPAEFSALRSHNASAVVVIGGSTNAFTDSRLASGSWLDTAHGLLWLQNRIEVDMFNLLYTSNTKIPYTQEGINTTVAVLERSLSSAVRNGFCAPGYLPDGTYLPEGFIVEHVALADIPVSDKGNRVYRGLSFKMIGAGALHSVEVSGQFSE